jgi:hypothetical protein
MFELIGLAAAITASGFGYIRSRDFVARRLRYVEAVRKPSTPLIAAAGATALAVPVVMLLPIVGAGTALMFGMAVGLGTHKGIQRHSEPAPY